MKKNVLIILILFVTGSVFSQTNVDVSIGGGYPDEVYYDFVGGSVKTSSRSAWDVAFTTNVYDVSVLLNNGNGLELYTYPDGDIDDWESVDITNIGDWPQMYNSIEYWEGGAFLMNALDHPDYGWGVYNDVTHNITGDSIFIIKLATGAYKKFAIIEKNSMANQWEFKYADIDGSNEVNETFDADDYATMNFIHYSIETGSFVEQEAGSDAWKLLFTRYYDYTIGDDGYMVTGILSNNEVFVQEVKESGLDQTTYKDYDIEQMSDVISTIGSDWKEFDMTNMVYVVSDTTVYFVQDQSATSDGSVWKIYFTAFDYTAGKFSFVQENLSTGINYNENVHLTIYPNPAGDFTNLIYDVDGEITMSIYDINGKLVYGEVIDHNDRLNKHQIDVSGLSSGFYTVLLQNEEISASVKLIKQ
jgi:hypothetical protein